MLQFKIAQGGRADYNCQAANSAGPVGGFSSGNVLSGIIWPAGSDPESALAVTPTVSWIVAASGTFLVSFTSSTTTAIPTGNYFVQISCTSGSDRIDLLVAELVILGSGSTLAPPTAAATTTPSDTDLGLLPTLYCTDEHIAVRCGPDFTSIQPDSQLLALGNDGTFTSSDAWTMTSASNNFDHQLPPVWWQEPSAAVGSVGYICWLRKPQSAFPAGGQLFGISKTNGTSLQLRRIGMAANAGQAPAPSTGLTAVSFQIATFRPQIEEASYQLNQRYKIDASIVTRDPTNIADIRVLRRTCVAMVLLDRYSDASRAGTGDYGYKVGIIKQEIEDLRAMLTIRWGLSTSLGQGTITQSNWFSTRIVR